MRDKLKVCRKCKESDTTSFSSCRFCGTAYGASATNSMATPTKMANVDQVVLQGLAVVGLIGVGVAGYFGFNWLQEQETKKILAPIAAEIQSARKPRVVEFFTDKGVVDSKFDEILAASEQKYAGAFDVQRVSVNDPSNASLVNSLKVYKLPRTLVMDKSGALIADIKGSVPADEVNDKIEKALHMK